MLKAWGPATTTSSRPVFLISHPQHTTSTTHHNLQPSPILFSYKTCRPWFISPVARLSPASLRAVGCPHHRPVSSTKGTTRSLRLHDGLLLLLLFLLQVAAVGLRRGTSQVDARVPRPASSDAGGARVVEDTRSSRSSRYTHQFFFYFFNAHNRPARAHRALKRRRRGSIRRPCHRRGWLHSQTTTLLAKEGPTTT